MTVTISDGNDTRTLEVDSFVLAALLPDGGVELLCHTDITWLSISAHLLQAVVQQEMSSALASARKEEPAWQ